MVATGQWERGLILHEYFRIQSAEKKTKEKPHFCRDLSYFINILFESLTKKGTLGRDKYYTVKFCPYRLRKLYRNLMML